MDLGSVVVTAAGLSFLGLGAPEGYADWGQMISFSRNWLLGAPGEPLKYWYTVIYPGLAIVLFVLAWNLIGDAARDILDPKIQT
jgi:peptide/nickel transport system permease protein